METQINKNKSDITIFDYSGKTVRTIEKKTA